MCDSGIVTCDIAATRPVAANWFFFVWIECYVNKVTRPMLLLAVVPEWSNGKFSCSCRVPCQLSLLDWLNVWFTLSCCWTHLYSCIIFVFDTCVLFLPLFCRLSFYCFISVWFYPVDTSCMYGIAGRLLRPHAEPSCWRMPDLFPSQMACKAPDPDRILFALVYAWLVLLYFCWTFLWVCCSYISVC